MFCLYLVDNSRDCFIPIEIPLSKLSNSFKLPSANTLCKADSIDVLWAHKILNNISDMSYYSEKSKLSNSHTTYWSNNYEFMGCTYKERISVREDLAYSKRRLEFISCLSVKDVNTKIYDENDDLITTSSDNSTMVVGLNDEINMDIQIDNTNEEYISALTVDADFQDYNSIDLDISADFSYGVSKGPFEATLSFSFPDSVDLNECYESFPIPSSDTDEFVKEVDCTIESDYALENEGDYYSMKIEVNRYTDDFAYENNTVTANYNYSIYSKGDGDSKNVNLSVELDYDE